MNVGARTSAALFAACAAALFLAYALGTTAADRLSNHAGYFLVPVADSIATPAPRPRHTVFVLVDGLTRRAAETLASTQRLSARGQCRTIEVGPISVSRPAYAVASTGLEQDRTGCRNNRSAAPLAADSIWQAARRSGLRVNGASGLTWWKELFPDGFDRYDVVAPGEDVFARLELADLNLVHPLYVDEMGHRHGAASPEYAAAVARVDRELGAFLDRVDLERDLVVLTADHGHTSYGGHGGAQREVVEVLTCFAGPGVRRRDQVGRMDARSVGPAVAMLAGVPFPRHMAAVEDDLDVLFDVADVSALPAAYVADRRAAIDRFRAANRDALETILGDAGPPAWSTLYARAHRAEGARAAASLAFVAFLFAHAARRRGARATLQFAGFATFVIAVTLAVFAWARGSVDLTSINDKNEFVTAASATCAAIAVLALVVHRLVIRNRDHLFADELTLVGLTAGALVTHVFVYGWPLGFALPSVRLLFFPFFAPIFLFVHATIALVLCAERALRSATIGTSTTRRGETARAPGTPGF